MPIALLMAAFCFGLMVALLWLCFGGSGMMALVLYVLSGHLVIAGVLSQFAMRRQR
ncbi:hypothetical protein OS190_10690 [Sulfitobacter sp. F26204]|uniref:hypothetical protein n=1 Tax=Sulfitobacter sp. F26204 TaxID=2996014 RepID=UPI00225E2901|nr:hypothetical protein [Sulfitobacter sp. F26204]MCX7560034.1 hypothetical protein [Sulfitobacter sp. F26204]